MEKGKSGEQNNAVAVHNFKVPSKTVPKPRKVLTEDEFAGGITKIIERDFFPDIPKLEAKAEYYDALERNDLVKLREIQMRYKRPDTGAGGAGNTNTPLTFETPEGRRKTTPHAKRGSETEGSREPQSVEEMIEKLGEDGPTSAPKLKLDAFLARNTSEDSASFADILKEAEVKHRHKHQWLFDKEKECLAEHEDMLALPSIEEQAMITDRPSHLNTWEYHNRNTVMYVPQGVELSVKEQIEAQKHKPREIIHENTRFQYSPFGNNKHKEAMQKAATFKALINHGKIGHDGKEIQPDQSPTVNGFGFVGTPSPAPGAMGESPMMTWGELDSTPARLDGGGDDVLSAGGLTPGPVFKIPEMPRRDRLALELSEKASKAHRAKKEEAIKQVTRRFASPSQASRLGLSSSERLSSMSPAAQRLASKRLGIRTSTDKALQDSYTPSPSSSPRLTPRGSRTPVTPGSKRSRLGSSRSVSTPGSERGNTTPTLQQPPASPSLTDHLLNLPKRARKTAADFF